MVLIIIYLLSFVVALFCVVIGIITHQVPMWMVENSLIINCAVSGGLGGAVYCLRGIYLNYSVKKTWDRSWYPWYVVRPLISVITGGISYAFLRAGLLILDAKQEGDASSWGYYALAFIAGLNVDKFLNKLEDLAKATWGIEKSRASKNDDEPKN